MNPEPIKVAIGENHDILRKSFEEAIQSFPRCELIFSSPKSFDLLDKLYRYPIDVLILTPRILGFTPSEIMHTIRSESQLLNLKIILLSNDPEYDQQSLDPSLKITAILPESIDIEKLYSHIQSLNNPINP